MENNYKVKKLPDLEKERDLLNAEILNMKNEIMTMESIKIENLKNRESNWLLYLIKELLMKLENILKSIKIYNP